MYHAWSGSVPRLWDDLRFPAQNIRVPAGSGASEHTSGAIEFAGNADGIVAGVAQMPHTWRHGSAVHPHIHLNAPTSEALNTRWKFEYSIGSIDGAFSAGDIGTYTALATVTVANPQDTDKHIYKDFGADINMSAVTTVSSIIMWKMSRLASTDELDNDTNAWLLLELDFHYQNDTEGSRQETVK